MGLVAARSITGVLLAVLLLPAIAGCTGDPPAPVTPAPTGAATAPPVTGPTPRLAVACGDLSSESALAKILTEKATVRDPAAVALASVPDMPSLFPVRSLGGLVCEWSDGHPFGDDSSVPTKYVGARVSILPEAEDQWNVFAGIYLVADGRQLYCTNTAPVRCQLDALVGGNWIEASLTGLDVDPASGDAAVTDAASAFFDPAVATVAAAAPPGPAWKAPAGTAPLPVDCDAFLAPSAVMTALALDTDLVSSAGGANWSQSLAAFDSEGALPCSWVTGDGGLEVASLRWLPGGSWGAAEARAVSTVPTPAADITLAGMMPGDSAYLRCSGEDAACWVDVVLGGNWIEVSVGPGGPPGGVDHRTAALRIAEAVVVSVYA